MFSEGPTQILGLQGAAIDCGDLDGDLSDSIVTVRSVNFGGGGGAFGLRLILCLILMVSASSYRRRRFRIIGS